MFSKRQVHLRRDSSSSVHCWWAMCSCGFNSYVLSSRIRHAVLYIHLTKQYTRAAADDFSTASRNRLVCQCFSSTVSAQIRPHARFLD